MLYEYMYQVNDVVCGNIRSMTAWLMWSLWFTAMDRQVEKGVKAVMKPKLRKQQTRQRLAKSGEDEMPGSAADFVFFLILGISLRLFFMN